MSTAGIALRPFPTVFGRNLLCEVPNFAAPPYLVVTMADLWPALGPCLPAGTAVRFVESLERCDLEAALPEVEGFASVIGLGGGQAIDVAKYFAWRRGLKLHQFPTSLSVDAMFGQRAGLRENGRVRYLGWAVPETVYFDLGILEAAPPHINRAGIGDVFCFFTGVWDWEYSQAAGRCEPRWPYDAGLAATSLGFAERALEGHDAIRDLTPEGMRLMVDAFQWGGSSYHAAGWCPRHIEGVEHHVFYALEAATGRKFLHGQAVCLGLIAGALMHDRRAEDLRRAVAEIGVDIRPAAMGLRWLEVEDALTGLADFVREECLPHGIAHDFAVDRRFLARLRSLVEEGA